MKKKVIISSILFSLLVISSAHSDSRFIKEITQEKLKLYPIPQDYRNYFFLQSIENNTSIIIGDFTGSEKIIAHIIDKNSDNTIDRIIDYYPDSDKFRHPEKSKSSFFTNDISDLKRQIIDGAVFRENYAYKMKSLQELLYKLSDGADIYKHEHGYSVKFLDPDLKTTSMTEFFFGKKLGRYDLVFKTNYYKLFRSKIVPPIVYSVYCRNSKDPVVAEIVESLLKKAARVR